jgi:hypothetical protein
MVSLHGERMSLAPSKGRASVQSATRSSVETGSCRRSAVRLARTCFTRAVCSSGSRRVTRALARCVGRLSTSIEMGFAMLAHRIATLPVYRARNLFVRREDSSEIRCYSSQDIGPDITCVRELRLASVSVGASSGKQRILRNSKPGHPLTQASRLRTRQGDPDLLQWRRRHSRQFA